MFLRQEDVQRLLDPVPYIHLKNRGGAKFFAERLVRDAIELKSVLAQFPSVKYEPLDQHYVLLKSLGCISEELVADLCSHFGWRGVVWAAWLAALAPRVRYRSHLAAARERVPHNRWLVDLSLAEIDGAPAPQDAELQTLIQRLRSLLAPIALPSFALRPCLIAEEIVQLEAQRRLVEHAYKSRGLAAALSALQTSSLLRSMPNGRR